ncbi:ornithine cyclodeaminase family protein [Cellulomonas fimi]|uniref:Ornithine cyclodeaminase family protein n=1 Tax=Cellulomonas fimi TaxID=1708 RepID=A0A7Y0M0F2_CELFI|nr:ornithine cyclodeaminase family protein [Cellulomonas fimi]NMR20773.1 ornithine cyclodeaminase family protein [Cellulomonas fimi]
MLILTADDVRSLLTMLEAVDAARDAVRLLSTGGADVPLRLNLDVPEQEGHTLVMPARVPELGAFGLKVISLFTRNAARGIDAAPAHVLVLDAETGQVVALVDGVVLTQRRTGAVQGVATDALARSDARTGALLGTGSLAPAQLEAMLTVRDLDEVRVYSRDPARTAAFVDRARESLEGRHGARLVAASSATAAVEGADVVTAATPATTPVVSDSAVAPGAHVNAIGAFTPAMRELDPRLVGRAGLVVVDTPAATVEAGDLVDPIARGLLDPARIVELGAVVAGRAAGRTSDDQVTVFKCVGSAVLDVVTAQRVYAAALDRGIGQKVAL